LIRRDKDEYNFVYRQPIIIISGTVYRRKFAAGGYTVDKVIAEISALTFLAHPVECRYYWLSAMLSSAMKCISVYSISDSAADQNLRLTLLRLSNATHDILLCYMTRARKHYYWKQN